MQGSPGVSHGCAVEPISFSIHVTELPDLSNVKPVVDRNSITQSSIQFSFTQWTNQNGESPPDKYQVYKQKRGDPSSELALKLDPTPGIAQQTITAENLQPDTEYRFLVEPVIIDDGNEIPGHWSQPSEYYRTLPGNYSPTILHSGIFLGVEPSEMGHSIFSCTNPPPP